MSAPPNIWTIILTELLQITDLMKGDLVLLNLYSSPEFQVQEMPGVGDEAGLGVVRRGTQQEVQQVQQGEQPEERGGEGGPTAAQ